MYVLEDGVKQRTIDLASYGTDEMHALMAELGIKKAGDTEDGGQKYVEAPRPAEMIASVANTVKVGKRMIGGGGGGAEAKAMMRGKEKGKSNTARNFLLVVVGMAFVGVGAMALAESPGGGGSSGGGGCENCQHCKGPEKAGEGEATEKKGRRRIVEV